MQTERLLALAVVVKVFGKNREKVFGKSGKTGKWEKSGFFPFSRFPVFPKHSSGQKLFGWRLLENCLEKRENGKSEDFSRFPVFPLFPNTFPAWIRTSENMGNAVKTRFFSLLEVRNVCFLTLRKTVPLRCGPHGPGLLHFYLPCC